MYFEKIYMHGFKSFADPVTIDFNDGITCIVGPNGSGKSNISDAIRWVLGEQSPKMLRGGKMEEVIFAGTATRKSRGMAEVTLVIDNQKGILPIEYQKVAITRRMYRSGEGEYFINGNHCRLRDIRELIMDTGIGVDGYSLIGQGKISDIVSSKPEIRREIFEEAAGIVKYRTKKYDAEKKLDNSTQNLDRVNDIINEIEGRIGGLKTDSEKAKEYLEIKDRYDKLEINITLKTIEDTDIKNEYIKDDILELSGTLSQAREEKDSLNLDMEKAKGKNAELEDLINKSKEKHMNANDSLAALIKDKEISKEKLENMIKERSRIENQIGVFREKLNREEEQEESFIKKLNGFDKEKNKLEEALAQSIEEYDKKNAAVNENIISIDNSRNKIFELQSEISSQKSEITGILNLRENLVSRKEELDFDMESSEFDLNLEELNEAKNKKKHKEEENERFLKELDKIYFTEKEMISEINSLEHKIRENNIFLEGTKSRKKTLEELEQSYEGYSHGVKFIMNSGIAGLYGTVADLISVDSDKRIAVETALGYGLQNIVCKDDISAKKAINLLKEKRAGRLTFLPVSSMKGTELEESSLRGEPGFVGVASKCITFDKKYESAIKYLLGKVVLVDNIDTGVAMSKNNHAASRFVTLTGEVISPKGAMTGGNLKSNKGGLLMRKAELSELNGKIDKLQRVNGDLVKKLEDLNKRLSKNKELVKEKEEEKINMENQLTELKRDVAVLEMKYHELSNSHEKKITELKKLEEQLKESALMVERIESSVSNKEKDMQELIIRAETDQREGEQTKEELKNFSEIITQRRIDLSKITAEYEAAGNSLRTLRERIEEYTKEIEDSEEALSNIDSNSLRMEEHIKENAININMAELEVKNIGDYGEELEEEKAQIRELIEKLEVKIKLLDEDINGFSGQKYELEIKQAKQETMLENLKEKLWEEFEISYVQAVEYRDREIDLKEAQKEAKTLKSRLRAIGEVNIGSIREYESVNKRYEFLVEQRDDLNKAMTSLKEIIDQMDRNIKNNFNESFFSIMKNFDETFKELFGGGTAKLSLEDESRPLDCNIEITAQPPGKKLQNINLMSGGEKTMTAIALMFAVLKAKPTPFCILDEVEAALDDANIERFAKYLRTFENIQFALVTHQKATMEYGDSLFGVTMPEQGISKVLSLKLGDEINI